MKNFQIDVNNGTATVGPGLNLAELNKKLSEKGF